MRRIAPGTRPSGLESDAVALPPGFRLREPVPADAERIAELANAETIAALGFGDTTADELLTDWSAPREVEGPRAAVVEDAAGAVTAYLCLEADHPDEEVFGYAVLPLAPPPGLAAGLLEELEQRAAWWRAHAGSDAVLRLGALDAPSAWPAAIEAAGYRRTRRFLLMRRSLEATIEPPVWPDGIALRPFDRADARAVHAALAEAFVDHWGPPFESYERWWHTVFDQPSMEYRDDLILVAHAGGEVAGALLAAARATESREAGYVAELGVRRPYRGHGLGHALLLEAFRRFQVLGRREALLHVDQDSETGATSVYRRAGMREEPMYASWERPAGA
jgi:ribosomal protein S18 acetylase RimI-like enzyme